MTSSQQTIIELSYSLTSQSLVFFFLRFYLFLERGEGREKRGRETLMCGCLTCPLLGIWPETQASALTGNQTSNPQVLRPVLHPLSHTSQDIFDLLISSPAINSKEKTLWMEQSWILKTTHHVVVYNRKNTENWDCWKRLQKFTKG